MQSAGDRRCTHPFVRCLRTEAVTRVATFISAMRAYALVFHCSLLQAKKIVSKWYYRKKRELQKFFNLLERAPTTEKFMSTKLQVALSVFGRYLLEQCPKVVSALLGKNFKCCACCDIVKQRFSGVAALWSVLGFSGKFVTNIADN